MTTAAGEPASVQRQWWLRLLAVFSAPASVFGAMRDDSNEAARARQEPALALVILAGIAGVLSTTIAGRLLDDPGFDLLLVVVWAFLGGALYGLVVYWVGGMLLHAAGRAFGSRGSYRRARHVLAFAAAPLALSLLLIWPVRVGVFGGDLFRTGGADSGSGDLVFEGIALAFAAWSLGLLVVGVRAVHAWGWTRAVATVGLAAVAPALLVLLSLR